MFLNYTLVNQCGRDEETYQSALPVEIWYQVACSYLRDLLTLMPRARGMLVQKGQYIKMHLFTSSFVYLCQDLHTSKTRFEYTYQDLRIRIKIRLRVHQV